MADACEAQCNSIISFYASLLVSVALTWLQSNPQHDLVCGAAGLGYLGAAVATSISLWLQFITLLIYIVFFKVCCLCKDVAVLFLCSGSKISIEAFP